jgi:hypothetical protein
MNPADLPGNDLNTEWWESWHEAAKELAQEFDLSHETAFLAALLGAVHIRLTDVATQLDEVVFVEPDEVIPPWTDEPEDEDDEDEEDG